MPKQSKYTLEGAAEALAKRGVVPDTATGRLIVRQSSLGIGLWGVADFVRGKLGLVYQIMGQDGEISYQPRSRRVAKLEDSKGKQMEQRKQLAVKRPWSHKVRQ